MWVTGPATRGQGRGNSRGYCMVVPVGRLLSVAFVGWFSGVVIAG